MGLVFGFTAKAQIADRGPLSYSFGGVYTNINGEKLSKDDLQGYLNSYQYADYLAASRKFKTGVILSGVGAGCFVITGVIIGSVMNAADRYDRKYNGDEADKWSDEEFDNDTVNVLGGAFYGGISSWVFIAGGVVCTAIGVPKIFIGNNKLKKVANDYNNQPSASLSIGLQPHGFGLAYSF